MEINDAMLALAKKYANELGYIDLGDFEIDAIKEKFWGNHFIGVKAYFEDKSRVIVKACKYIYPVFDFEKDAGKVTPKIEIDMHFGNPRLSIRKPDNTFACLTYSNGSYSEGQAFNEAGPELLLTLKNEIDKLIAIS